MVPFNDTGFPDFWYLIFNPIIQGDSFPIRDIGWYRQVRVQSQVSFDPSEWNQNMLQRVVHSENNIDYSPFCILIKRHLVRKHDFL